MRSALGTAGLAAAAAAAAPAPPRPNILLILCDDMGWSDLGCYGSEIRTPNLDRLAAEGVRFTRFYNCARCCPTRASLLTGLYPHDAGMGGMVKGAPAETPDAYQGYLNDRCVTLAEVLGQAGYDTLMAGKWHVGEFKPHWPADRGFRRYYGLLSGAMNYFDIRKAKAKGLRRGFARDGNAEEPPAEGFYATDAFTDAALEMLAEHGKSPAPFFLYLAYNAPHWPLHAHPEDIAHYRGTYRDGWEALREKRYARQCAAGIVREEWGLSPRDPEAAPWSGVKDRDEADHKMAIYAAQVECMDRNIGRVLDRLRETGQLDDTLVLFLSDNGACAEGGPLGFDGLGGNEGPLGTVDSYSSYGRSWSNASNTPFRLHKSYVHEGGISTPLIGRWPGRIRPGTVTEAVGHVVDIMATCCDVAGADYPTRFSGRDVAPAAGKSLVPVFEGMDGDRHEFLAWEHLGSEAILMRDRKLVRAKGGPWELYDARRDRAELRDLVVERRADAAELLQTYLVWADSRSVRRKPAPNESAILKG